MLGPETERLLVAASDALGDSSQTGLLPQGRVFDELSELLSMLNGFYAFESALHVFGRGQKVVRQSLETWNSETEWKSAYEGLADEYFFFAEDLFGVQFAIRDGSVVSFDPETAEAAVMASGIEDWARQIIRNYGVLTGFPLAHAWQQAHGVLQPGRRLVPKRPFVLGGDFSPDNLYDTAAADGMRLRAELAIQIRDLPDGDTLRYRVK